MKKHRHLILNIYLFLNFAGWGIWQTYQYYVKGTLGYVEISFTIQSLLVGVIILIRKPHQAFHKNLLHQAIAIIAFCSGAAFMGQPATGPQVVKQISQVVIFCANVLGVVTLLNLGRSFGILIAFRELKSQGLYGLVRHPMYGTDILLRIGFLISHFNLFTLFVFIISAACYVYRAILEERFLIQQPEYREYMKQVRYRFIPFVL
ncbi:MAG: methyltransferase family protein [Deltaproteobacteria bacterium]